jgi:hypothetical protein
MPCAPQDVQRKDFRRLTTGRRDELNSFAIASSSGVTGPLCRRKKVACDRLREVAPRREAVGPSSNRVGDCASLQGPGCCNSEYDTGCQYIRSILFSLRSNTSVNGAQWSIENHNC